MLGALVDFEQLLRRRYEELLDLLIIMFEDGWHRIHHNCPSFQPFKLNENSLVPELTT
jgi:hypothetical protein